MPEAAVTRHRGGWRGPGKSFAVGLGREIRDAHPPCPAPEQSEE
ncbi:hypothetical protein AB0N07_47115 [Streptomyces sp. NPDC051172]